MLSLLKRHRERVWVAALLFCPLATFLFQGGKARDPGVVDRALLGVTVPLQRSLVGGGEFAAETARSYVALRGVREENERLLEEERQLRGQLNGLVELRAENLRLKAALGYVQAAEGAQVLARVVGYGPASPGVTLRLNRGTTAGIQVGMPVISVNGVVGVVVRAVSGAADVALISDPQTRMGVRIQRSRARATVAGAGAVRPLRLEHALRMDDIRDGDVLVTSGADGVFPAGLMVGHVRSLSANNLGIFQDAEVHPAVELNQLEEVLVLTSSIERTLEPPPPPEEPGPDPTALGGGL